MEREQAAEIQDYLLDAAFAVDEARAAIDLLSEGEREKLAAPLGQVMSALHDELLRAIHGRFPDLIPFREFPAISSALRWDQVRLPPGISEADIDAIILSVLTPYGQKMAMVVVNAMDRCREVGILITTEGLAARIQVLAETGLIEGEGDLRRWRHSEVRLKG